MTMDKVEAIKAEIERRIAFQEKCIKNGYRLSGSPEEEIIFEYKRLLDFIDLLLEEPVISDLDEAATHHKEMVKGANRPETEFANTDFIAGAMWYKYNVQKSSSDIDFEKELYKHFGQVKDFMLDMRIAKYFYELKKVK